MSLHGKTGLLIKNSEDGGTGFGAGSVVGRLHRRTNLGWGHEPGGCGGAEEGEVRKENDMGGKEEEREHACTRQPSWSHHICYCN